MSIRRTTSLRRRRAVAPPTSASRVEAFSDGVFAIAITLLVLEIHVPDGEDADRAGGLVQALAAQWPSYLSYLAAFATIGAVWLNHHAAFTHIARVDRSLLNWNLLLLLATSFVPFPTALVADHLRDGLFSDGARVATTVYAIVGIACCLPWIFIYRHIAHHSELIRAPFTEADVAPEMVRGWIGVLGFALSAVVAALIPPLALLLFLAGSIYFAVTAHGPAPASQDLATDNR
jgi:uncharacterized membrane protein